MSTPATLDLNDQAVKTLMNHLLYSAYTNGPYAQHEPLPFWNKMDDTKPPSDTIMPLLMYMEKFGFVKVMGESGFGRYCEYVLTDKSRKIFSDGPPPAPRNPIGY